MSPAGSEAGLPIDQLQIAVRAYAHRTERGRERKEDASKRNSLPPSEWTVVFDTETTTDQGQALRIGTSQVRKGDELIEAGLFYRPEVLSPAEVELVRQHAERHGLKLRTHAEFVDDVIYGIGYDLRATIVGFNLPFDISRIALGFGSARGAGMRGGFTFKLSADKRRPQLRVKHASSRISFISFAAPFRPRDGRSLRRKGRRTPVRRGFFVDVSTLGHALFSRSFTLGSLADHLATSTRKLGTEEHGGPLTPEYIHYAVQDTQVTWECFVALRSRYAEFELATPIHKIYSEASLGKAYLDGMNVRPWREVQPGVPPELIGTILSTFYGGRSEVRIRRELRQVVLCDFLSMYPTVCTLMGLWRVVIAKGVDSSDDTAAVISLLDRIELADLFRQETWKELTTLVQVLPQGEVFPVRADYDDRGANTIGANHLTSEAPVWFTLADCIASKLLTGRPPKVVKALRFSPMKPQAGLRPILINGDPAQIIRPRQDDLYRRVIQLRQGVKRERDAAQGSDRDRLDAAQYALKIVANATSYGIFAEVNVQESARCTSRVIVHCGNGDAFDREVSNVETPGRHFHPLVATLITGAARLMLAITERLAADAGLEWSFCDTDSMAIARPPEMEEATFHDRVDELVARFSTLNPYGSNASVLQIESVNESLDRPGQREPLFCYAVSAKRYALFNLDGERRPVLRKASAHGLGHLRAPYDERNPAPSIPRPRVELSKIGVALWQHDLWWSVAKAALHGPVVQLPLDYHPALLRPAVGRYAATTPVIQRWFNRYNENRSYDQQVKPFGFLLVFMARANDQAPVAPFDRDPSRAVAHAFDRNTGLPIDSAGLKTYAQALAQYHLHPEAKFLNGRHCDHGTTSRRHVLASGFDQIGKEANRLEEQFFLGLAPEAQVRYGAAPNDADGLIAELGSAAQAFSQRHLADELGVSRNTLSSWLVEGRSGYAMKQARRIRTTLGRLKAELEQEKSERSAQRAALAEEVGRVGLSQVAKRLGTDPSNLRKFLNGSRSWPGRRSCQDADHNTQPAAE
jgi:predicted transcriptional regulator with HTH domain